MSQKIFKHSFFTGLLILVLCAVIFVSVMYRHVEDSVFSELGIEAAYLAAGLDSSGEDFLDDVSAGHRITWVDADGSVLYDNRADAVAMENHLDREEIASALQTGTGQAKHYSNTMTQTTLYYALKMEDGTVIRVAATQDSILAVLIDLLSPIIWTVVLISLLCGILASRLAKQITAPINGLDLDEPEINNPYKELRPLAHRVQEQNKTIRRQMDELGARQREFAAITENMSEGLVLADNKGRVIFSNHSGLEFISREGAQLAVLSRASCIPAVYSGVEAALAGQRYENVVGVGERALQLIVSPVISSGQVSGAVLLVLDVTEREKRDELRREFSANVSHELKTPLTSISGFAELMKEGLVPEEKMREFSADIYSGSRRLISMIDDIIRLSQIDESSAEPDRENVDLYDLTSSVAANLAPAAEKMGVSMDASGEHAWVYGSRRILEEMIFNLSENAIKYNRPGGWVKLAVYSRGENVVLSVEDNGIGIPAEHHKRIFERFYRVDKSHSKAIGGTGLGLSIVRHGAKFHDARIELRSEAGKGSEFLIIFPAKEKT